MEQKHYDRLKLIRNRSPSHLRQDGQVVGRNVHLRGFHLLTLAGVLGAPPPAHVLVHARLAPELQSVRLRLVAVELGRWLLLVALGAFLWKEIKE